MLTFDIREKQKVDTKQEAGKERREKSRQERRKIEKMRMNAKGLMTITIWLKALLCTNEQDDHTIYDCCQFSPIDRLNNWTPKTSQHEDSKTDNLWNFLPKFYIYFLYIYNTHII